METESLKVRSRHRLKMMNMRKMAELQRAELQRVAQRLDAVAVAAAVVAVD